VSILENEAGVIRNEAGTSTELPVPLYEHVKRRVAEAILLGELPPGTVLPGEVAMAADYGVSVGTMRRALADLTADGMLMRRRKTGTVVTGRTPQHSLRFFFQYYRLHRADGGLLTSRAEVLSIETGPAGEAEAELFGEPVGEPLLRLERVRRVDGRAVMHTTMSLVKRRIRGFPETPEDVPQRIYLSLLDAYGIRISAIRENVSAALADERDAARLDLELPAALMVIDELAFDQHGQPTIEARHRVITDHYRYINEIR
jgi:GntR family transcriptional regulator